MWLCRTRHSPYCTKPLHGKVSQLGFGGQEANTQWKSIFPLENEHCHASRVSVVIPNTVRVERFCSYTAGRCRICLTSESLSTPILRLPGKASEIHSHGSAQMRQLPLQGQLHVLGKPAKSESNVAAFAQYAADESKDLGSRAAPRTLQDLSQAGPERTSHSQLFPTTRDGESYFICSLRISGRGSVTEQPHGEGDRALPQERLVTRITSSGMWTRPGDAPSCRAVLAVPAAG